MSVTVNLDDLENGQEILPPREVSGSASSTVGNITAIAWQINDGELKDISPAPATSPAGINFTIGTDDCPANAPWHILTVFAWDDQGNSSSAARTFGLISEEEDTTGGSL